MASKVYLIRTNDRDSASEVSTKLARLIKESKVLEFIKKDDFTAIKLHFGDKGNTGHIRSEWVKEVSKIVGDITDKAFLTDSNVIYKASLRTDSIEHTKIASEHGFSIDKIGIPVIISDGLRGRNFVEVPVAGKHFQKIKMASDLSDCDSMLALTHITGHILTGVGGSLKNVGMGCSARRGKYEMHCGTVPEVNSAKCASCGKCVPICPAEALSIKSGRISINESACLGCGECAVVCPTEAIEIRWSETLEKLQEKMVEYAKGVIDSFQSRVGYINFLTRITKDCDCLAKDDPSIVGDIGILASSDPVAIDKASIDLVLSASLKDPFKEGYPQADWSVQLNYASRMGLGSQEYDLVEIP